MSCLCLWLSLLCASSFLPSASSEEGVFSPAVSLKCNQTAEVAAENSVTLNCSISIYKGIPDCKVVDYVWLTKAEGILCDNSSMKYKCEWDEKTYVSLTISNPEAQNYTIKIQATCGLAASSIEVQLKPKDSALKPPFNGETEPQDLFPTALIAALSIFVVIIVLVILLYFLRRTKREKENPVYEMTDVNFPSWPLKDFETLTM